MYVFALDYGNVHSSHEVTQMLYAKHSDAVEAAERSAQEAFDADPSMLDEGFCYDAKTDQNGNTIITISQRDGTETYEWWRVVKRKVY